MEQGPVSSANILSQIIIPAISRNNLVKLACHPIYLSMEQWKPIKHCLRVTQRGEATANTEVRLSSVMRAEQQDQPSYMQNRYLNRYPKACSSEQVPWHPVSIKGILSTPLTES